MLREDAENNTRKREEKEPNLKRVGRIFLFYRERRKMKITVKKERGEDTGQILVGPRLTRERKKIESQIF